MRVPITIVNIKQVFSYYGEILYALDEITLSDKVELEQLIVNAIRRSEVTEKEKIRLEQLLPDLRAAITRHHVRMNKE